MDISVGYPSVRPKTLTALLLCAIVSVALPPARADVIVLANRAGREMPARFTPVTGQAQQLLLPVGECLPIYLDGKAHVAFSSPGGPKNYLLNANSAYYFGRANDGHIDLQEIGLGEDGTLTDGHSLPGTASTAPSTTITVKILVDEEEPAPTRLGSPLAAARRGGFSRF